MPESVPVASRPWPRVASQLVERGISTAHKQYPSIEWDSRTEDAPKIEEML
jgi:hypothetical protein